MKYELPTAPRERATAIALVLVCVGLLWVVLWSGILSWILASILPTVALHAVAVAGAIALLTGLTFRFLRRDYTDSERSRHQLEESVTTYRSFFDHAADMMFMCDPSGRFRMINRAGLDLLGVDPVAERLSLFSVVAPEHAVQVSEIADPSPEHGDRLSFAVEVLTRHGARVPVQIITQVVRDNHGVVRGILGSARKISDQHLAGPGGRKRPSHLRILIEHLPEGIALLDHDGTILLTNPPAEDFLKEYGTYLADNRLVLFGGIPIERILERASAMLRQEVVVREPYHQILEVTGQGFSDEDSIAGAVLVIRDVTSERQRRERLERNDRLAAVGQLAAGIAHDFKNILQGIHLCAELSRAGQDSAGGHKDNMLTIIEQTERGSKLIQQIMDFTRQSESTQRLLNLGELLTDTCELLAPGIPETILLSVDLAEGEHSVMADPGQVQQVVANLVLNARDAMPNGGRLSISLTEVGTEGDSGTVPIEVRDGEWLRITVTDTGTGIPKSVQHRVFEPFFTTKRPGSGTGLGLAQVYGNVQQHGGYVDFESTVDIGTSFFVFLPAYRHHLQSESQSSAEGTCEKGGGETVLVVEDELSVLSATAQSLRSLGYQVLEAVDGQDALQLFDTERHIDLVLTDSRMPGVDGPSLAAEVKRRTSGVKIVMMTAYAPEPGLGAELPAGVDGLLRKPFSMKALARMVHQTLQPLPTKAEVGGRE